MNIEVMQRGRVTGDRVVLTVRADSRYLGSLFCSQEEASALIMLLELGDNQSLAQAFTFVGPGERP